VEALRENLAEQMSDFNKENDELEERGNEVVKQLESITDRIEITGKNGNRIFKDMPDEELDSKLDEITAKASEISKDAEKLSKKLSAIETLESRINSYTKTSDSKYNYQELKKDLGTFARDN
jgi:chromosome segregation ATPase